MLQLYEFSVLRFYRLFLLTLQSIDTLRLTNLPFYGFTTFSCPLCPRKNINLPIYGFAVASFAFTCPPRFYRSTASRLHYLFLSVLYTQSMNLQICGFTSIPCACTRVSRFYAFAMCLCWVFFSTFNIFHRWCYAVRSSHNCWRDWCSYLLFNLKRPTLIAVTH